MNIFENIAKKLKVHDYKRYKRLRWSCLIFLFCLLYIFTLFLVREKIFISTATHGIDYIVRFLWVLPFSFIGFSFLAFRIAKNGHSFDNDPWESYLFSYFPRLIAWSLIIFSVLHIFNSTSNFIYYFFSAGLGLYLGYAIDLFRLDEMIKKITK